MEPYHTMAYSIKLFYMLFCDGTMCCNKKKFRTSDDGGSEIKIFKRIN